MTYRLRTRAHRTACPARQFSRLGHGSDTSTNGHRCQWPSVFEGFGRDAGIRTWAPLTPSQGHGTSTETIGSYLADAGLAMLRLPWGDRSVRKLSGRDVRGLIERKAEHAPIAANRLLAVIRKMLNVAVDHDWLEAIPPHASQNPHPDASAPEARFARRSWMSLNRIAGLILMPIFDGEPRRHRLNDAASAPTPLNPTSYFSGRGVASPSMSPRLHLSASKYIR